MLRHPHQQHTNRHAPSEGPLISPSFVNPDKPIFLKRHFINTLPAAILPGKPAVCSQVFSSDSKLILRLLEVVRLGSTVRNPSCDYVVVFDLTDLFLLVSSTFHWTFDGRGNHVHWLLGFLCRPSERKAYTWRLLVCLPSCSGTICSKLERLRVEMLSPTVLDLFHSFSWNVAKDLGAINVAYITFLTFPLALMHHQKLQQTSNANLSWPTSLSKD